MEVNFTKLGSAPVIKLSFLSPNPDFGTVLWDIGADCPQTSLLFRQSAPCYDWTIGGVLLAAGRRQGSGRYKGLALSCLLLVPVTVAPGSGSCFQVFRFLGIFFSVFTFPEPASLHRLGNPSTRGPVRPLQRPGARFCTLLL